MLSKDEQQAKVNEMIAEQDAQHQIESPPSEIENGK